MKNSFSMESTAEVSPELEDREAFTILLPDKLWDELTVLLTTPVEVLKVRTSSGSEVQGEELQYAE